MQRGLFKGVNRSIGMSWIIILDWCDGGGGGGGWHQIRAGLI